MRDRLQPFTLPEAGEFISARRTDATPSQIEVVHHRAEGNPRVIANLIEPDRDLVSETQTDARVELNDLIQQRIARAVQLAEIQGANPDSIAAFLCALSLLPPPVPVGEAAVAFGVPTSEIESFAADLAPLLDRTRHGIIFRDEPTETFVSQRYGGQVHLLNDVVARLTAAQSQSVYAARSLPGLLSGMGRIDDLHRLAFDTAFPATLTGDVAKRVIRLNRLRTAVGAAARARRHDAVVDMLVELSTVVAVDERGQDYLLAHPDLVIALGDSDALRRLFESKTAWAGSRHARLMDMWLPSLERGEDDNGDHVRFGRDVAPLEAWITDPHVELQIDDNDPSGVREALQRPRPASRIIRSFRLRPEKPWANSWIAPGKRVAFRPRAWGRQVGNGDRKDSDSGAALFAARPFLTDFLTATDRDLLLLIKLQHFRESERFNPADDEPSDRFTHAYSLLLVDRQLRVRPIVPTPADVATVAGLDKYSIHDFQKRFAALSKSRDE